MSSSGSGDWPTDRRRTATTHGTHTRSSSREERSRALALSPSVGTTDAGRCVEPSRRSSTDGALWCEAIHSSHAPSGRGEPSLSRAPRAQTIDRPSRHRSAPHQRGSLSFRSSALEDLASQSSGDEAPATEPTAAEAIVNASRAARERYNPMATRRPDEASARAKEQRLRVKDRATRAHGRWGQTAPRPDSAPDRRAPARGVASLQVELRTDRRTRITVHRLANRWLLPRP